MAIQKKPEKRSGQAKPYQPILVAAIILLPLLPIALSFLNYKVAPEEWLSGGLVSLLSSAIELVLAFYFAGAFLRSGMTRLHFISLGFLSMAICTIIIAYNFLSFGAVSAPYVSYIVTLAVVVPGVFFLLSALSNFKVGEGIKKNLILSAIFFVFISILSLAIVARSRLPFLPVLFDTWYTETFGWIMLFAALLFFITSIKLFSSVYKPNPTPVIFWFILGFSGMASFSISVALSSNPGDVNILFGRGIVLVSMLFFLKGLLESKEF